MAGLREALDNPSIRLVLLGYSMDGHFVAKIAELEGGVKSLVNTNKLLIFAGNLL